MSSYIALAGITPDLVLSSSALRAQISIDAIVDTLESPPKIHYMDELYMEKPKTLINVISLQDDQYDTMMVMGHNPELTELANLFVREPIRKLPTLGLIEITFEIERWEEITKDYGTMGLFIYPNQFKYYIPKRVRDVLKIEKAL